MTEKAEKKEQADREKAEKKEMAAMVAAAVPSGPNPQMNENTVKKRKATSDMQEEPTQV